ncbi:MAG: glycosyltransferase, partial [Candidatus Andersenbacteria bacterium]|nr:glycosyltransferase [Candidatus Andersenbacteria bacterium]
MNDFNFPISKPTNRKDYYIQRFVEMLPGIITWSFLIGSFYLAFKLPFAIAIFIIIFDLYWMVKVFYITVFIIFGYRRIGIWEKIDWLGKCEKLGVSTAEDDARECRLRADKNILTNWRDLYHLVIIPTYKEGIEVLETTLNSILNSDYPKDRIIIVAAFEERAGEEALERARMLEEKYKDKFFNYITTLHPDGISGEAKVKGANASWAAEEARIFLDEKNIKYENVIVSTFDSDTCVHQKYFSCIAYQFMINPKRLQCS